MQPTYFPTARAFRAWLQKHHGAAKELLVDLRKADGRAEKGPTAAPAPGMTWSEAVDQALCFGWIDGVRRRVDDTRYTIRFTPRRPGSTWSAVNIDRIARLEARGLMAPAGLAAFAERSEKKSRTYSYERPKAAKLDSTLEKALASDRKAWEFFQAQAPSYQRKIVHWVVSARKEETRLGRLRKLMSALKTGQRP